MWQQATERLILRDFQADDFEAFYATTSDPAYQQFYTEAEMSRAFWEELFARLLDGAAATERSAYQLAVCLPEAVLIGTCGVRVESVTHRQASFGCAIGRPFWRKSGVWSVKRET